MTILLFQTILVYLLEVLHILVMAMQWQRINNLSRSLYALVYSSQVQTLAELFRKMLVDRKDIIMVYRQLFAGLFSWSFRIMV